jgi:hypothetical protein
VVVVGSGDFVVVSGTVVPGSSSILGGPSSLSTSSVVVVVGSGAFVVVGGSGAFVVVGSEVVDDSGSGIGVVVTAHLGSVDGGASPPHILLSESPIAGHVISLRAVPLPAPHALSGESTAHFLHSHHPKGVFALTENL